MSTAAHSLPLSARTSGAWTLAAGRAIAMRPRQNGEILIINGAVWATLDGPHEGLESGPLGDLYLQAGERLRLIAGRQVVLEPFVPRGARPQLASAVKFDWVPSPQASAADSWEATVAQPADDLGRALGEAQRAFGRLVRGVLAWGGERLAPRTQRAFD
ncbi:DUF2917 domain-containing protein [Ottowia sp. VDI28]|uniref:DUF2917 domain-containing protein n=1 Tax=Ottowia sp. VDI28 TaxID=3133968 RepID=UPI003C2F0BC4